MDKHVSELLVHRLSRRRLLAGAAASGVGVLAAPSILYQPTLAAARSAAASNTAVQVTIQAPGKGDVTGVNGAFTIVDLELDAATGQNAQLVGQPRFIAPTDPAFGPGPNPAVPGLVVLFSTTKAFSGPQTNLANLFQLTGVGTVNGNKEVWTTWLVGKPIAAVDVDTVLTVFVVSGTAPAVVPTDLSTLPIISNVATVTFQIAGATGIPMSAHVYHAPKHHRRAGRRPHHGHAHHETRHKHHR
jgi:hypothetical protein